MSRKTVEVIDRLKEMDKSIKPMAQIPPMEVMKLLLQDAIAELEALQHADLWK